MKCVRRKTIIRDRAFQIITITLSWLSLGGNGLWAESPVSPIGEMPVIQSLPSASLEVAGRRSLTVEMNAAPTPEQVTMGLHRAVKFFRTEYGYRGAYPHQASADLSRRTGESKMTRTQGWIENPGTPAVGMAYLSAYELTRDPVLLEAAIETGQALVKTQFVSGGWDSVIELDPAARKKFAYRGDHPQSLRGRRNSSTLDDDKSQSTLRFLMALDFVLDFKNAEIHDAVQIALDAFLKAQYPNGAWPHSFSGPVDQSLPSILKASFPESWPREHPRRNYEPYYTINDNGMHDVIQTMLLANDIYGEERFLLSARRGGDFLILAQMPAPQPAWAQQYDFQMQPAWARKFEPPAICGNESLGVLRILIELATYTGEERYLQPVPPALAYLRSSLRPDGQLARFYELKTNRPLYFTSDYKLTYDDNDVPTHYSFMMTPDLDRLEQSFSQAIAGLKKGEGRQRRPVILARSSRVKAVTVQAIIQALDGRGAWVETGRLKNFTPPGATEPVIESRTFIRNLNILAQFLGRDQLKG